MVLLYACCWVGCGFCVVGLAVMVVCLVIGSLRSYGFMMVSIVLVGIVLRELFTIAVYFGVGSACLGLFMLLIWVLGLGVVLLLDLWLSAGLIV